MLINLVLVLHQQAGRIEKYDSHAKTFMAAAKVSLDFQFAVVIAFQLVA